MHVSVTCDNENIKNSINSNVKRELRSLTDVIIVEREKATWFIEIVAIENHYVSGKKSGDVSIVRCYYYRRSTHESFIKEDNLTFLGN